VLTLAANGENGSTSKPASRLRTRIFDRLPGDQVALGLVPESLATNCMTCWRWRPPMASMPWPARPMRTGAVATWAKRSPLRSSWTCGVVSPDRRRVFRRISKAAILADLQDARQAPCAPSWEKMKKVELAALAERETAATGRLPEPLR
jgi:hypothetical protein